MIRPECRRGAGRGAPRRYGRFVQVLDLGVAELASHLARHAGDQRAGRHVHAFERACGREIPFEIVGRRAGDVAVMWADPSRAKAELGWEAMRSLDEMCADACRWQSQNPDGYSTE